MPTILPNAKNTFTGPNGTPLSGGSVYFYIPSTTTPKNTYQDPAQTILNTNPIVLDANGQAIIWGSGSYRQQVFDANNNLIWDQVTEDTTGGLLGNMVDNPFVSGTGFVPGTTTQLTLSSFPGAASNVWVYFDTAYQTPDTWSLSGNVITFNSPIPVGVQEVNIKVGTTAPLGVPSNGSVGDAQLAWGTILNRVVDSIASLSALNISTYRRAFVTGYYAPGDGGGGPYSYSASTPAGFANGGTIVAAAGGVGCWILQATGPISVKQFGAKGDGVHDDAPPIQACIAACNDIYVADGTYLFNSTTASPVPATDPQNVLIQGKNNFRITASRDASFVCSNTANNSCMFTVYNCQHFLISGFTLTGNRTGLTSGQETVAINLASVVDFEVSDIHVAGNWGDSGAMLGGDWWVNGRLLRWRGDQVGIGMDIAFYQGCVFDDFDINGFSIATGGAGNIGLSTVYDVPNANANVTGVSFTNTNRNYFRNVRVRNMNNGVSLSSGSYYYFDSSCDFSNNPGTTVGTVAGFGFVLTYFNGGSFTSVGNPVNHVFLDGCKITNNGMTFAGGGALISASAITNSDQISSIYMRGCDIDNNSNIGVQSNGEASITVLVIDECNFSGGAQTTAMSPGILGSIVSSANPAGARVYSNPGFNPVGFFGKSLPGGTGAGNTIVNTAPYPVRAYIYTQTATYTPNVVAPSAIGGAVFTLGSVVANSGPCILDLPPGYGIYFTTAVPTSWEWLGL